MTQNNIEEYLNTSKILNCLIEREAEEEEEYDKKGLMTIFETYKKAYNSMPEQERKEYKKNFELTCSSFNIMYEMKLKREQK